MTGTPVRPLPLDVVVPAYNEEALVRACLAALCHDADRLDLRIVVVANGCTDRTVERVRDFARDAERPGLRVVLLETPVVGKAAAINLGDRHRRGWPVVYLDADTLLLPGTLPALADALHRTPLARLAAPPPVLVRPHGRLARDFGAVWSRLPAVAGQVFGGGCYAVNPAGRTRWSALPDLWADDAFVRARFAADECRIVPGGFRFVLPEGRELVRVVGRWRRGNTELARLAGPAASPSAGLTANLALVSCRPRLWPHLPGFLLVNLLARLASSRHWARADRLRARHGAPLSATVDDGAPGCRGDVSS